MGFCRARGGRAHAGCIMAHTSAAAAVAGASVECRRDASCSGTASGSCQGTSSPLQKLTRLAGIERGRAGTGGDCVGTGWGNGRESSGERTRTGGDIASGHGWGLD